MGRPCRITYELRSMGLKVAFVSVCGDDIFGRFILCEMQTRGIDISNTMSTPLPGGTAGQSTLEEALAFLK
jgi:sugar/nucleoside kinase (ribokinase family)